VNGHFGSRRSMKRKATANRRGGRNGEQEWSLDGKLLAFTIRARRSQFHWRL